MKTLPSGKPQCDGANIVYVLWKSLTGETKKSKTGCNVIFSAKRSRVKYNGHFRKHLITPFQYNYLLPFRVASDHYNFNTHIAYKVSCPRLPGGSVGKESDCNARRPMFDPWVRKIPLEK